MMSVMEVEKRKNKKNMVTKEEEEEKEDFENRVMKKKPKKNRGTEEEEEEGGGTGCVVPTEEEVEEFYAILRRMKVAVKYFDDRGRGGGKEWRQLLENADVTVHHAGDTVAAAGDTAEDKRKIKGISTANQGFDLNAVAPEAAESGGA